MSCPSIRSNTDFKDDAGLAAECAAARRSGFAAKMAIHPAQVPIINQAFSASEEELAWARKVVAVFAETLMPGRSPSTARWSTSRI